MNINLFKKKTINRNSYIFTRLKLRRCIIVKICSDDFYFY